MSKVKVVGGVLALATAVSAPQAGWWLLSSDRHALSSTQVEAAVRQELEIANGVRLDRVECAPIERPPGTSICDVQEADVPQGFVFEVGKDGTSDLFKIKPGDVQERPAP